MYAAWMPTRTGQPWEDWEDAAVRADVRAGCTMLTIAMRARRTESEVRERMAALGLELRPPRSMSPGTKRRGW